MAPEAPGNLVVIDLRFRGGELKGYVQNVEYSQEQTTKIEAAGGWFYVLWNETPKREGFKRVGDGVVYVQDPPLGYRISAKSPVDLDSLGDDRYAYHYIAIGEGLMFVLILPKGYTLTDSQPMPRSAKIFKKKQLAVYWKPDGKYGAGVKITWEIKKFDGDIRSERDRINADIDKSEHVPDNAGALVDEPNRQHEDKSASIHNPWVSGSFYLAAFVLILSILLVAAKSIPLLVLPVIIVGALLSVSVVGAFQLRQDGRLTPKNFLKLMILTFKQLPLLKERKSKSDDNRT